MSGPTMSGREGGIATDGLGGRKRKAARHGESTVGEREDEVRGGRVQGPRRRRRDGASRVARWGRAVAGGGS